MKIGDLPELTSLASIASGKVPIEDSSGTTKRVSVQNLVKSVWDSAAPITTITDINTLFDLSDDSSQINSTITAATLYKSGRVYELHVTLQSNAAVTQADYGRLTPPIVSPALVRSFRPLIALPGIESSFWGFAETDKYDGRIRISHLDGYGTAKTINPTTFNVSFVYMR